MANANLLTTEKLTMPVEVLNDLMGKVQNQSVIATLVPTKPQSFISTEHIKFTRSDGGEWVDEGGLKSSGTAEWTYVKPSIHKAVVSRRFSNEFQWADEDAKTEIVNTLIDDMSAKMAEMIDAGAIHAAEPKTRTIITGMKKEALAWTGNQVAATTDIVKDIDAINDSFIEDYDPTAIAFDRMYANEMRKVRNPNTGLQMYPQMPMGLKITDFNGLDAVVSGNVSGKRFLPANSPSGIKAIAGDFRRIQWGYVREFGVEPIYYGDPDGGGDLKRMNEVCVRLEAVLAWMIEDPAAFTILRDSSTIPSDDGGDDDDEGGDENQTTRTTTKATSK